MLQIALRGEEVDPHGDGGVSANCFADVKLSVSHMAVRRN